MTISNETVAKKVENLFGKRMCNDLYEHGDAVAVNKKPDPIGLEIRHVVIIGMAYNSIFSGQLTVGDIIIGINGNLMPDLHSITKYVATIPQNTKITIRYVRLKKRLPRPPSFPRVCEEEGYRYETAVVFNLKGALRLGLDVRDIDGKVVVCHAIENTIADITFPLGVAIIDIDGEQVTSVSMFGERLRKSLEIRNYALVLMALPNTDVLRNMIRNKIAAATKDAARVVIIPSDVKAYCIQGIAILRKMHDPKPVYREPASNTPHPRCKLDERVKEFDVPGSWNTSLFVKVLPAKNVETETQ